MAHYEKVHQHISSILESRGLDNSLPDLFGKHTHLSFKFWRMFSFVTLLPLSIQNSLSSKNILASNLGTEHIDNVLIDPFFFAIAIVAFFFPIIVSTIFLTHLLPLYKLAKKPFYKKYLEKYFRKSITIASSCDTLNYKEEHINKYVHDKELNLAMSAYYTSLLEFPFSSDIKQAISIKQDALLDIDLSPEKYQKKFTQTIITFIGDVERFSKCPVIVKSIYDTNLLDYTKNIVSPNQNKQDLTEFDDCVIFDEIFTELNSKEKNKKILKNML